MARTEDLVLREPAQSPSHPWVAVRVKRRFENPVIAALSYKGYESFCPCYKVKRRWVDRTHLSSVPLFPGYIFCRLDPNNSHRIVSTPGVIYMVSYCGDHRIPETEIEIIRRISQFGLDVKPHPYLREGIYVRITAGPLAGATGLISSVEKSNLVVLSVNLLQRSVAVTVDSHSLEMPDFV
jgi:transcription antitermination factor NusG